MIKNLLDLILPSQKNSEEIDSKKHIHICCLALLIEVAKADAEFSEIELKRIRAMAYERFSLPLSEDSFELARDVSKNSTSVFEFTSVINEHYSMDEKFLLIMSMWTVAYADGQIDRYEEHLIRKVSDLIYLPHVRFIEAKHIAAAENQ